MLRYNPLSGNFDYVNATTLEDAYTQSFNATTDWGAASGGFYTIVITEATHQRGLNPTVSLFETSGSDNFLVYADRLNITTTGQVEFRVPDSPDLRFAGKIIITR